MRSLYLTVSLLIAVTRLPKDCYMTAHSQCDWSSRARFQLQTHLWVTTTISRLKRNILTIGRKRRNNWKIIYHLVKTKHKILDYIYYIIRFETNLSTVTSITSLSRLNGHSKRQSSFRRDFFYLICIQNEKLDICDNKSLKHTKSRRNRSNLYKWPSAARNPKSQTQIKFSSCSIITNKKPVTLIMKLDHRFWDFKMYKIGRNSNAFFSLWIQTVLRLASVHRQGEEVQPSYTKN